MCSVKCLGKVALNDIKPSEDSNNKATEEKIKKIFGNFYHFPRLLTVSYVWGHSSDNKSRKVW